MANKKIVKYKKPINIKFIKIIIFLFIIYTLILLFTYTKKGHITIYEVNNAQIADDTTWSGFIIRNEKIFKTKHAGYINYYNPAGNRVGIGDILYTIDSTGDIADYLADMDHSSAPNMEEIKNMRTIISSFREEFDFSSYNHVYDYHYDVENAIFEQSQDNLYSDLEKILKANGKSNMFHKISARRTGVISYSIDGYENVKENAVTKEHINEKSKWEKTQLREKESVEIDSPVYRLIINENWSIVVPIDNDYYEKLKDKKSVKITIKNDNNTFTVPLRLEIRPDGYYAVLTMDHFLERYCDDRFLEVEISLNSAEGLKIPNSSILEEEFYKVKREFLTRGGDGSNGFAALKYTEDGSEEFELVPISNLIYDNDYYYVRKDSLKAGDVIVKQETDIRETISAVGKLKGVYCVNDGFCKFVRIDKIYENSEYTIVNDSTPNGLSLYDHIVTDPLLLNENDFIQ